MQSPSAAPSPAALDWMPTLAGMTRQDLGPLFALFAMGFIAHQAH